MNVDIKCIEEAQQKHMNAYQHRISNALADLAIQYAEKLEEAGIDYQLVFLRPDEWGSYQAPSAITVQFVDSANDNSRPSFLLAEMTGWWALSIQEDYPSSAQSSYQLRL